VIADLLGVPAADRETLRRLAHVVMQGYDIGGDLDTVRRASEAAADFAAYFETLINSRAEARLAVDDLIEHFGRAERGGRLERAEIYDICRFLVIAGFETTLNLIGTGIFLLLGAPREFERLLEAPAQRIGPAVEELLRMVSPVQRLDRYAREGLDVRGKRIRRGDSVRIMLGAANHDPAEFPDPERLDITRNPQEQGFTPGSFDLVISRLGVMFFADPTAAFRNLLGALKPSGRLVMAVWAPIAENTHWKIPFEIAVRHLGEPAPQPAHAPGPHAFGDRGYLRGILEAAGYASIAIEPRHFHVRGDSTAAMAEHVALFGAVQRLMDEKKADAATREAIIGETEAAFAAYVTPDGVRLPATFLLVSARPPS